MSMHVPVHTSDDNTKATKIGSAFAYLAMADIYSYGVMGHIVMAMADIYNYGVMGHIVMEIWHRGSQLRARQSRRATPISAWYVRARTRAHACTQVCASQQCYVI